MYIIIIITFIFQFSASCNSISTFGFCLCQQLNSNKTASIKQFYRGTCRCCCFFSFIITVLKSSPFLHSACHINAFVDIRKNNRLCIVIYWQMRRQNYSHTHTHTHKHTVSIINCSVGSYRCPANWIPFEAKNEKIDEVVASYIYIHVYVYFMCMAGDLILQTNFRTGKCDHKLRYRRLKCHSSKYIDRSENLPVYELCNKSLHMF